MSNVIPFNFNSIQVRVVEIDNEPWFVAKDVAEALGYKRPKDAISQHCKGAVKHRLLTAGGLQELTIIPESDMYRLTFGSKLPKAEAFVDLVTERILPSIRKTGAYSEVPLGPIVNHSLNAKTHIAEAASRMLRMSGTSTIRMLGKICEEEGVSSAFLPDYTDEHLTRALGDLLKEHGSELSAIAANKRLIEMGYLEELSRRSSKKGEKKFKSITDKGLKYGKNETSKQNPNETQPRYFVDTFPELLDLINNYKRGNLTLVEE